MRFRLALMYKERFRYKDAAQHFELVVQRSTKVLGAEHAKTIEVLSELESCKVASEDEKEMLESIPRQLDSVPAHS